METITLEEVVAWMDQGREFSIGIRTCNKREQTGGEYIQYDRARKYNPQTAADRRQGNEQQQRVSKNPQHYINSTRNICVITTGAITKIHLRLIVMFNGKKRI